MITSTIPFERLDTGERSAVVLSYNPEIGPLEITFTFEDQEGYKIWTVARELIRDALANGRSGLCDVKCVTIDKEFTLIISSPDGSMAAEMHRARVQRFLSRTNAILPIGSEVIDVDAMIAGLLEDAE